MRSEESSFRDPAAQVVIDGERLIRMIYPCYFEDYGKLMDGLYDELIEARLLIPHKEVSEGPGHVAIEPERVPFISYPYEWCFSMLKEAALNTLEINRRAMNHGMMLKDASAYNMQWYKGKMTLIDTCSFVKYEPGMPWYAYPQFLRHFLCPLLLMAYKHSDFGRLSEIYLDGIPVPMTARLLPAKLRIKPSMWAHVYAQALNFTVSSKREVKMSKAAFGALLGNLDGLVRSLEYKGRSDWTKYGEGDSYTATALESKRVSFNKCLDNINGNDICDIGANTGDYSAITLNRGFNVISADMDHDCINEIYSLSTMFGSVISIIFGGERMYHLPLIVDLCNPSPAIGFNNTERKSFLDRLHVDTIMALALIHHLCVANNIPLGRVASMLAGHCKHLIIEFVPLEDPKAQLLLGKKNIPPYSLDIFKAEFGKYFTIKAEYPITESLRTIYLMEKR